MDISVREIMNRNQGKYKLRINSSIYLQRSKGGRGLKNLEDTYKQLKIKSAIKIVEENEPRIQMVRKFEEDRMQRNRSSVIKDAIVYTRDDFGCELNIHDHTFTSKYTDKGKEEVTQNKKEAVKDILKKLRNQTLLQETTNEKWQGVLLRMREEDDELIKDMCFSWLVKWKDFPTRSNFLIYN